MFHFIPTDAPDEFGDDPAAPRGPTETPPDASTLGVKILLLSLAMLFGATLIGYALTRFGRDDWAAYRVEGFEIGIGISTALILVVSLSLHLGLVSIQRGGYVALKVWMVVACAASVGFVASQLHNWAALVRAQGGLLNTPDLSTFMFYGMTFLHALHVIGGYIPLFLVTRNAFREHYAPARFRGIFNCALYWHFIDGVWVVMAAMFLFF